MSVIVTVDVFDFGTIVEARALEGKYAAQGPSVDSAVERLRERLPLNELPEEPAFRTVVHAAPKVRE